jgi:hypothetical protein
MASGCHGPMAEDRRGPGSTALKHGLQSCLTLRISQLPFMFFFRHHESRRQDSRINKSSDPTTYFFYTSFHVFSKTVDFFLRPFFQWDCSNEAFVLTKTGYLDTIIVSFSSL